MMNWSRSHPGYAGEKLRLYSLDITHWEQLWAILQRRQAKREALQRQRLEMPLEPGSPVALQQAYRQTCSIQSLEELGLIKEM